MSRSRVPWGRSVLGASIPCTSTYTPERVEGQGVWDMLFDDENCCLAPSLLRGVRAGVHVYARTDDGIHREEPLRPICGRPAEGAGRRAGESARAERGGGVGGTAGVRVQASVRRQLD